MSRAAICRYDSACLHDDAADVSIESARFEGYGPGGAAVIVDCLTDNRNRTVAELRHVFTKYGGNLGAPGSVAYLFKPVGRMSYPAASDVEVCASSLSVPGGGHGPRARRVNRGADRPVGI